MALLTAVVVFQATFTPFFTHRSTSYLPCLSFIPPGVITAAPILSLFVPV